MNAQDVIAVENFLKEKTRFCKQFNARISKRQCEFQSAKAVIQKKKREIDLSHRSTRNWERQKLLANCRLVEMQCLKCDGFIKPSRESFKQVVVPKKISMGHNYFKDEYLDDCVSDSEIIHSEIK